MASPKDRFFISAVGWRTSRSSPVSVPLPLSTILPLYTSTKPWLSKFASNVDVVALPAGPDAALRFAADYLCNDSTETDDAYTAFTGVTLS